MVGVEHSNHHPDCVLVEGSPIAVHKSSLKLGLGELATSCKVKLDCGTDVYMNIWRKQIGSLSFDVPSLSTALKSGHSASRSFASRGGAGVGGGRFVTGGLPWL
jgi:hypothetical protein